MRKNETIDRKMLALERVENLMLVAVLGQEPYRSLAQRELHRRKLTTSSERLADCIHTNLSVAC